MGNIDLETKLMLFYPCKAIAKKGQGQQKMVNDDLKRLMLFFSGKALAKKNKQSRKRITMTWKRIDFNSSG